MNNATALVLYCNPAQNDVLQLWLGQSAANSPQEHIAHNTQADNVLKEISMLLNGRSPDVIVVVNQARSFTFVRIVATICNTLAFATGAKLYTLDQPVEKWVDISSVLGSPQKFIIPRYSKPQIFHDCRRT